MTRRPNNFPREGDHQPVTREAVTRLEADRPKLNAKLHYTIGGTVETVVHSNANAEREAAITAGARALQQSSERLREAFKHPEGDKRAAYIRAQKALADHWLNRSRTKTPSR